MSTLRVKQSANLPILSEDFKPASWRPTSWRSHPALHQPAWPDQLAGERATDELSRLPSLVPPS